MPYRKIFVQEIEEAVNYECGFVGQFVAVVLVREEIDRCRMDSLDHPLYEGVLATIYQTQQSF